MYASKQARFLITETNAGVRYQEFSNLSDPLPLVAESDSFDLSPEAQAIDWSDGLISQGSKVILSYDHPHFGQFPAVVSTEHGRGRITTVGTLPNPALAADLVRWLAPQQQERWSELPESVTVNSATNRDGQRIHVVHNWSWQPVTLTLPQPLTDVLDNESQPVQEIALGPWDVRVLAA
jgi:beta-galactosidase